MFGTEIEDKDLKKILNELKLCQRDLNKEMEEFQKSRNSDKTKLIGFEHEKLVQTIKKMHMNEIKKIMDPFL